MRLFMNSFCNKNLTAFLNILIRVFKLNGFIFVKPLYNPYVLKMKKLIYLLLGVIALFTVPACQDNRHAKNYNDKTLTDDGGLAFIKGGLEGGLTEIRASQIAKANSTNPRIISFADMMITDHTQAGAELRKIEAAKMVDAHDTINMEHKQMIVSLKSKTGADFDKAYINMMIADHEKAVGLFTDATNNTSNLIQDFSRKTLPKIQMHLDSARAIAAALK
jgi:putative membrane protein